MKKLVALFLALALLTSYATMVFAESETLKLTQFGRQHANIGFEDVKTINAWQTLMDMFAANNLEVEFEIVERDQTAAILQAYLASGDIPDVFYAGTLSDADRINLIDNGLVMDINEALQYSNGAAAKEFEDGGAWEEARRVNTYSDGGMYTFGYISMQYAVNDHDYFGPQAIIGNNCTMLVRQDWLDALELPVPATLDEVFDTLKAFQDNDMNGNGIADERIIVDVDSNFNGIAQWFGLAPFNFQANRIAQEAVVPVLQEGYAEYINFMQKLVDNNLLFLSDEASYYNGGTDQNNTLNMLMQDDVVSMYYGVALSDSPFMAEDAFYTAMPNIKGSEMVNPVICVSSGYKTWGKWMFSAEADPKAVAAWLDTVCTQDYAKLVTFGIEGVTYEVDADSGLYTGTYSRDYSVIKDTKSARGYDLWIDSIMPDASMAAWYNQYYGDLVWATYDDFLASAYYNDVIKTTYTENQCRNLELLCGYSKEVELVYNFNDDTGMIAPMNTLDEAEVLDLYSADLNTMLAELNVGFLTGLYDINDLDSVIENLNILGLQEVLAVRQAQYDRYYGKVE